MITSLKRICFNSIGKGRVQLGRNRQLFSYESLNNLDTETWSLAVNIPLRGEERFDLNYREVLDGKVKAKGRVFTEILKNKFSKSSSRRKSIKLMEIFLNKFSLLLKLSKGNFLESCIKTAKDEGLCRLRGKSFKWKALESNNIELNFDHSDNLSIKFLMTDLDADQNYFRRISFRPIFSKKTNLSFNLDLFLSSCDEL